MTVAEYIPLVWLKFKGKGSDKAPTSGPKWQNVLDITNVKLREKWALDPKQNWQSLFRIDTVSAATSVELEDDVAKIVDNVTLVKDGQRQEVPFVNVKDRNRYSLCAYQTGLLPKVLNLNTSVPTQYVGGSIEVPVNALPELLTSNTDDVLCDNIAWLIAEVAADLAFKKPHYGNLVNEANDEYEKMCAANQSGFGAGEFIENGYGSFI